MLMMGDGPEGSVSVLLSDDEGYEDYTELLSRSAPFAAPRTWSAKLARLPPATALLLLFTITVTSVLFLLTNEIDKLPSGNGFLLPTISRLGAYFPAAAVYTAGFHVSAVVTAAMLWCVRLSHLQQLSTLSGEPKYQDSVRRVEKVVDRCWAVGVLFCIMLSAAAAVPPDKAFDGKQSSLDWVHGTIACALIASGVAYVTVTVYGVLVPGRMVFLVSRTDNASYRCKRNCLWLMLAVVVAGVSAFVFFVASNHTDGEGGKVSCRTEWCASNSNTLAVCEYLMFLLGLVFLASLRYDLKHVRVGVLLDSVLL